MLISKQESHTTEHAWWLFPSHRGKRMRKIRLLKHRIIDQPEGCFWVPDDFLGGN